MIKQSTKVSEYKLPVKIEPQKEGGYVAVCPNWSACFAQGETVDEAILEITAVAQSLIELYKEEGMKIPLKIANKKSIDSNLNIPVLVTV